MVFTPSYAGAIVHLFESDFVPPHVLRRTQFAPGTYRVFTTLVSPRDLLFRTYLTWVLVPVTLIPDNIRSLLNLPVEIIGSLELHCRGPATVEWQIDVKTVKFCACRAMEFPGVFDVVLHHVPSSPVHSLIAGSDVFVACRTDETRTQYWLTVPPWDPSLHEFFKSRPGPYEWFRLGGRLANASYSGPGVCNWDAECQFRSLPMENLCGQWSVPYELMQAAPVPRYPLTAAPFMRGIEDESVMQFEVSEPSEGSSVRDDVDGTELGQNELDERTSDETALAAETQAMDMSDVRGPDELYHRIEHYESSTTLVENSLGLYDLEVPEAESWGAHPANMHEPSTSDEPTPNEDWQMIALETESDTASSTDISALVGFPAVSSSGRVRKQTARYSDATWKPQHRPRSKQKKRARVGLQGAVDSVFAIAPEMDSADVYASLMVATGHSPSMY